MTRRNRDYFRLSRLRHARRALQTRKWPDKITLPSSSTQGLHGSSSPPSLNQLVTEVVNRKLKTRWKHSLTKLIDYAFIIPWRA
ncbi:hypothetical protein TNCV_4063631 [Trichonephila clavipes]|nr:hypothetical protein TNCV_4063631 [Trichonephila clavipes]